MITIKNVDKIVGMMAYGRDLVEVKTNVNSCSDHSYIFVFKHEQDGIGWNKEQHVHLMRKENSNGMYQLFVMGLGGVTERSLSKSVIFNKAELILELSKCLEKASDWWIYTKKK